MFYIVFKVEDRCSQINIFVNKQGFLFRNIIHQIIFFNVTMKAKVH